MKFALFAFCSLLAMSYAFSQENQVTVFVNLSPAGSFQAVSSKIKGSIKEQDGKYYSEKLSVLVQTLKTGIDLRDEHLWKHLDPESKHNKIVVTNIKASGKTGEAVLEINGIKKIIPFTFVQENNKFKAKLNLKASQFNLPKVEYMGVGVDDLVKVEAVISNTK